MFETIHERVDFLVKSLANGNNTVFANLVGSDEASVRGYKKKVVPKQDFLAKCVEKLGVSPEWILTGRGEVFPKTPDTSETVTPDLQPEPTLTNDPAQGTPYFDVDFIGGFSEIFNDQTATPACRIIAPGFEKASVWCNVTGHSMEPKICHGDIIALRRCSIDDIQYGEIYAIVLDTIRTIKILRRGSTPDTLLFVPINKPDFEDQQFPIARIIQVYEVIGSISRFF